jgi:hypothetical protein
LTAREKPRTLGRKPGSRGNGGAIYAKWPKPASEPSTDRTGDKTMNDPSGFAKLVPGFDFLQNMVKNAGSAIPGMGQWVAPTIDPEELAKRIEELRTVQFWLEQNARVLAATIQAMEVQRMTLSTLKTMNVQMGDLRDSMMIKLPETPKPAASAPPSRPAAPAPVPAPAPPPAVAAAPTPASAPPAAAAGDAAAPTSAGDLAGAAKPGVVDPMQWWGALTRQFAELAANALKEGGGDAARSAAGVLQSPPDGASDAAVNAARPAARKLAAKTRPVQSLAVKKATPRG